MRALVTGGAGNIGAAISARLAGAGYAVTVADLAGPGASKAALASLTISGARELAGHGIRCNGVAPGYIGSGMGGTTDAGVERRLIGQVPLGRSGRAGEVAAVIGFLVGPDASYLTGEIIDVDGGWAAD